MENKLKNPPVSQLFAYEGLCSRHTKLLREGRPTRKNAVFMSYIDVIIYSVSVIKFVAFKYINRNQFNIRIFIGSMYISPTAVSHRPASQIFAGNQMQQDTIIIIT
mgnify:CR=1 FL=1